MIQNPNLHIQDFPWRTTHPAHPDVRARQRDDLTIPLANFWSFIIHRTSFCRPIKKHASHIFCHRNDGIAEPDNLSNRNLLQSFIPFSHILFQRNDSTAIRITVLYTFPIHISRMPRHPLSMFRANPKRHTSSTFGRLSL
jgi:hypothetical protein